MKKTGFVLVLLAGVALFNGCATKSPSLAPKVTNTAAAANVNPAKPAASVGSSPDTATNLLSSDKARESYAVGMYMGHGWKTHDVELDLNLVLRGIEDEESNAPTLLTEAQMGEALRELQNTVRQNAQRMQEEQQKAQMLMAQTNMQEGQAFLAENKTKPGVVTLPDGLQYKVIKAGAGEMPGPNDTVVVNYRGTYINGTEFDTSANHPYPAEFPVRNVIPGWTEALLKMRAGSKWELYIPSDLAYGPAGHEGIGPSKTLIFDVELLNIKPGPKPPPPPQPLTSDIIRVPSAEDLKNGAKIETIKASDLQKMQQSATNQ